MPLASFAARGLAALIAAGSLALADPVTRLAAEPAPPQAFPGANQVDDIALPTDGGDLVRLITVCEAAYDAVHQDPLLYRSCYAYQTGLIVAWRFQIDFLRARRLPEKAREGLNHPFCLGTASDSDINQAILDFVDAYPEAGDLPAPAVALGAFIEAFPCTGD